MSAVQVAQLYVAMFGRAPDSEGLAYWEGLLDGGESTAQVADTMFATSPARTYFPDGQSDSDVIASFYVNVLGRPADARGLQFWTDKLSLPGATRSAVLNEIVDAVAGYSGTDPAGLESAALFNNRVAAAQYFAEHGGAVSNASAVLWPVTSDPTTITAARTLVLPSGASGSIDGAGFTGISLGQVSGDVYVPNLASGATLIFRETTSGVLLSDASPNWTIHVQLANDGVSGDTLTVRLDGTQHMSAGYLSLTGVEHLSVIDSRPYAAFDYDSLYLAGTVPQTVSLSGTSALQLYGVTGGSIDATGMANGAAVWSMTGTPTMTGGLGGDAFYSRSAGGYLDGGAGADSLSSIDATVHGGRGSDTFMPAMSTSRNEHMVIDDFAKGTDSIVLGGLLTPESYGSPFPIFNSGTWHASPIAVSPAATLDVALNAAAALKTSTNMASVISWFSHGGDTFIVVDNGSSSTFVDGTDQFVELVGTIDLSTMSFGESSGYVPAVLK